MPAERAGRIRRLHRREDRLATLIGMALLADCARAGGLPWPGFPALSFPRAGKPAWPGGPDFNIAHCPGRVACAVAPAGVSIGVDLERAGSTTAAGLRLVATAAELDAFVGAGLTATDLWVTKEAVVNASGGRADRTARVRAAAAGGELDGAGYLIYRPVIAPDVSTAVAVSCEATVVVEEADALALLEGGP